MAQICYKYQDVDMGPYGHDYGECSVCCNTSACETCDYLEISMAYPYTDAHCGTRAANWCAAGHISGGGIEPIDIGHATLDKDDGSKDIDKVLKKRMQELANIKKK